MAIYFRASIAILNRAIKRVFLPLADFATVFAGAYLIENVWEKEYKQAANSYPEEFLFYEMPIFIVMWMTAVYLSGGYKKPFKLTPVIRGSIVGTMVVLVTYSLLDESLRFSRAILILSALWSMLAISFNRIIAHFIQFKNLNIEKPLQKRIAIVGTNEEISRVSEIMKNAKMPNEFIGKVCKNQENMGSDFLGDMDQLGEIIQIHNINEVIFCSKDISAQRIISSMEQVDKDIEFKIAPAESHFIIGSNSINSPGELYLIDLNSLNKKTNKRNKRVFDLISALTLLISTPILFLVYQKPIMLLKNIIAVIKGNSSWVGYSDNFRINHDLPKLKKGILSPTDQFEVDELNESLIQKINIQYVKDYSVNNDLKILVKGISKIAS